MLANGHGFSQIAYSGSESLLLPVDANARRGAPAFARQRDELSSRAKGGCTRVARPHPLQPLPQLLPQPPLGAAVRMRVAIFLRQLPEGLRSSQRANKAFT